VERLSRLEQLRIRYMFPLGEVGDEESPPAPMHNKGPSRFDLINAGPFHMLSPLFKEKKCESSTPRLNESENIDYQAYRKAQELFKLFDHYDPEKARGAVFSCLIKKLMVMMIFSLRFFSIQSMSKVAEP
jgi:hypothetical protein